MSIDNKLRIEHRTFIDHSFQSSDEHCFPPKITVFNSDDRSTGVLWMEKLTIDVYIACFWEGINVTVSSVDGWPPLNFELVLSYSRGKESNSPTAILKQFSKMFKNWDGIIISRKTTFSVHAMFSGVDPVASRVISSQNVGYYAHSGLISGPQRPVYNRKGAAGTGIRRPSNLFLPDVDR